MQVSGLQSQIVALQHTSAAQQQERERLQQHAATAMIGAAGSELQLDAATRCESMCSVTVMRVDCILLSAAVLPQDGSLSHKGALQVSVTKATASMLCSTQYSPVHLNCLLN